MSDQNVVTDWAVYFAALGPGTPTSTEQLEAMRPKVVEAILIVNDNQAGLMNQIVLGEVVPDLFSLVAAIWDERGRPEMWLQVGRGTAPWRVAAQPRKTSSLPF